MSGPELDVLVVGAGACGLAAAIAAHDGGASVAIVEKLDRPGGNSSLSTGSVPGAGSRFQREAGIEDSPEQMLRDLQAIAGDTDDPALLRRMVDVSAATVEWLVDTVRARMQLIRAYKHIGHTVPRLHAPVSRRGQHLVDDLLAAVETRGVPLAVGNGVHALASQDGAVTGAVIRSGEGEELIAARKVVLAVNGFAGNRDLVRKHIPEIAAADYFGALGSTGEAVLWGEALGAATANMAAYQGYAAVAYPQGSLLSWTTIEKGGVLVDPSGQRFGNEDLGYSGFARIVLAQRGPVFAVFDQRIFDIAAQEEEFAELAHYGGVRRGETLAEAVAPFGIDVGQLAATLERYNASARRDGVDRFGRAAFGLAPLQAPFYAARVTPGLFHTQGGLRVDDEARVLRHDGTPVPNLFAGGGAAAGISGRAGALGYASGNGLLTAIALGRLAGMAAAREVGAGA